LFQNTAIERRSSADHAATRSLERRNIEGQHTLLGIALELRHIFMSTGVYLFTKWC
jgi:hypothetical protein